MEELCNATSTGYVVSFEITINRALIVQNQIVFDQHFGINSTFSMGEEQIFLFDIKKANLPIYKSNQIILNHEDITTTDKINLTEKYFIQGAFFYRIFKKNYFFWVLLKLFFELKQNKTPLNQFHNAIKTAINGKKEFIKLLQN